MDAHTGARVDGSVAAAPGGRAYHRRMVRRGLALLALVGLGCGDSTSPPDATDPAAMCASCTADQICIQTMHSSTEDSCQSLAVRCVARVPQCTGTACTPECSQYQCNPGAAWDAGVLSCTGPVGNCPNFVAGALQCWGP